MNHEKVINLYDSNPNGKVFKKLWKLELNGEIKFRYLDGKTIQVTNLKLNAEDFEDMVNAIQCEVISSYLKSVEGNYAEKSIKFRRILKGMDKESILLVRNSLDGDKENKLNYDVTSVAMSGHGLIISILAIIFSYLASLIYPKGMVVIMLLFMLILVSSLIIPNIIKRFILSKKLIDEKLIVLIADEVLRNK